MARLAPHCRTLYKVWMMVVRRHAPVCGESLEFCGLQDHACRLHG